MYKNTKYFTKGHQFTSNIEILVMPNSSLTLLKKNPDFDWCYRYTGKNTLGGIHFFAEQFDNKSFHKKSEVILD